MTEVWSDFEGQDRVERQCTALSRLLSAPAAAAKQAAADARLKAALLGQKIDIAALEAALKSGANPDCIVTQGMPALHVAVHQRDAAAMALLLKHNATPDDVNKAEESALDEAYRLGFREGVVLLRKANATTFRIARDPYACDRPVSSYQHRINAVLAGAVRTGTASEVAQALLLGADPNAVDKTVRPPYPVLHMAILRCRRDKMRLLLDGGADPFLPGGRGETSIDVLWWARPGKLLGPDWMQIYQDLEALGCRTLFSKHPAKMTLDDLREDLPLGLDGATSILHFLVRAGKVDLVLDIIAAAPADRALIAADLTRRSGYYQGETLLDAFCATQRLQRLFSAEVWQGRLEEMMSLRAVLEKSPHYMRPVDFATAAADVQAFRLRELRRHAGSKAGLRLNK